jgi:tRNA(Arg) A34 adenosine deaminase TadA
VNLNILRFHKKAIGIVDREEVKDNRQKVVAFVLDSRGRILTEGWNSYTKTHPMQKEAALAQNEPMKFCLHAEVHALSRLSYKQLSKQHTIVVMRLDHKYRLMPSKPCPICQAVISQYGIENVIHS